MTSPTAPCPICRRPLPLEEMRSDLQTCPCPRRRSFEAAVFQPPKRSSTRPRLAGSAAVQGAPSENLCANHADNVAVASCERCGAFICSLCEIQVEERTLCPACFERLSAAGELIAVRTTFRDFGSLALICAVSGLIVTCLGIFLGPAALYFAVRALRQQKELGERQGRLTAWIAGALGAATTVASLLLWATMLEGFGLG